MIHQSEKTTCKQCENLSKINLLDPSEHGDGSDTEEMSSDEEMDISYEYEYEMEGPSHQNRYRFRNEE